VIGLHKPRDGQESHFAVTPERVTTLAEMAGSPTVFTQRCVECVTFLPRGGQKWTRSLQLVIPPAARPRGTAWRIVSLGLFRRRRFPDFTVLDATGARINLLTRDQHGVALSGSFLAPYLRDMPKVLRCIAKPKSHSDIYEAYRGLRAALYAVFTTVRGDDDEHAIRNAGQLFTQLIRYEPGDPTGARERLVTFVKDLAEQLRVTPYLCWVAAEPGEVLNITVTFTSKDIQQALMPLGTVGKSIRTFWQGVVGTGSRRREIHARWYGQYGLAPINYEFATPSRSARSYYFTIEPPANTDVTYLDWETGNTLDEGSELESAYHSMHIHNAGDEPDSAGPPEGRKIRAYVRCAPNEHKKIAFGALLNGLFVALVASGRLNDQTGVSTQTWLLVTPTVLTAYLAQQQRHYYAHTTRRQRGILWVYLAISVAFLVTLAFSRAQISAGTSHWGWFLTAVAWLLAISSAAVFAWYAPLGYSFQRFTDWLVRRGTDRDTKSDGSSQASWWRYEEAVNRYCRGIVRLVWTTVALAAVGIALTWKLPSSASDGKPHRVTHAVVAPAPRAH